MQRNSRHMNSGQRRAVGTEKQRNSSCRETVHIGDCRCRGTEKQRNRGEEQVHRNKGEERNSRCRGTEEQQVQRNANHPSVTDLVKPDCSLVFQQKLYHGSLKSTALIPFFTMKTARSMFP